MGREIRRIGKEPKKITLSLNNKNILLRAIIAGVCLVLGIALLFNSCSQYVNRSTYLTISFPTFENENEEEQTLFDNNVDIQYYYDSEIENTGKSVISRKITDILEGDFIKIHKLCDYNDLYKDNDIYIHNLKYVNEHPNEWISLDPILYNLLKRAEELRISTNGIYSPFSGKLYLQWDEIFNSYYVNGASQGSAVYIDPLNNEYHNSSISSIIASINKSTTFIEFNDDNNQIKFNVSEEDKNNILLDLGLLESAYYLDELKRVFVANNLTSGYILNNSGMVITLGINNEGGFWGFNSISYQTLYNVNQSTILDYTFSFNGALNYMSFNSFLNIDCHNYASQNYYAFYDNNDNILMRSMILNSTTGYSNTSNYSTFTFSTDTKLVEQLEDNYLLYFNDKTFNKNYLLDFEDNDKYGAIVSFNDGNTNIEMDGPTTLLYSKLVSNYLNKDYIPYLKVSTVVKSLIVATKGE